MGKTPGIAKEAGTIPTGMGKNKLMNVTEL